MIQELKDKWDQKRVRADCSNGKHRWTKVLEKFEDGSRLQWNVCQTCGERDEPEALEGKGNGL